LQSISSRIEATKTSLSMLRTITAITLLLLAVQFLIGMVVNLFVQLPSAHPGVGASNYFQGVVQGVAWALVHAPLALLLIGLAIASRRRAWIVTSLLGWLGIMAAGFNGASFLNYGHDFSSLIMSIGFLLAVISYAIGFYVTR
jgi:hypothetical protein